MKYGMAEELLPATSEGGRAVEAFIKICPPADRANLDREWIEMCGLFVKGWLAKNAEQNAHLTGLHCPACMCRNEEIVTCARCGTVKSAPQVA